jgi:vacuolar-type H+-ATPase subunit F/Vma7
VGDPLFVYVPHPIQDRTDDEMKEIAQSAVGELLKEISAV